jgi:polyisoprenyl-phosphate glycosyltransferase
MGIKMKERQVQSPALSVVIPCYNEQGCIPQLLQRLLPICRQSVGDSFEVILVDDGSKDGTWAEIVEHANQVGNVAGIKLARNSGHQRALSAGLQQADGDYILVLDADLQDPPELLPDMLALARDGSDVVYGQRRERAGETWMKKQTASWFYRVLNRLSDVEIPRDTGDFRLMTRRVLTELNAMPESHRFIRGMVSWIGFKQTALLYDRNERFAGETHYPLKKMLSFALDAITSFSVVPLRLASFTGALVSGFSVLAAIAVGISYLMGATVDGWASLAVLILLIGGTQLLFMGVIGEYIGRIYSESKKRPLYIIDEVYRLQSGMNAVAAMHEEIRMAQDA